MKVGLFKRKKKKPAALYVVPLSLRYSKKSWWKILILRLFFVFFFVLAPCALRFQGRKKKNHSRLQRLCRGAALFSLSQRSRWPSWINTEAYWSLKTSTICDPVRCNLIWLLLNICLFFLSLSLLSFFFSHIRNCNLKVTFLYPERWTSAATNTWAPFRPVKGPCIGCDLLFCILWFKIPHL